VHLNGTVLAITLGNGSEFAIDKDNRLYFIHESGNVVTSVLLTRGRVTKKKIEDIQESLQRIKIHADD